MAALASLQNIRQYGRQSIVRSCKDELFVFSCILKSPYREAILLGDRWVGKMRVSGGSGSVQRHTSAALRGFLFDSMP